MQSQRPPLVLRGDLPPAMPRQDGEWGPHRDGWLILPGLACGGMSALQGWFLMWGGAWAWGRPNSQGAVTSLCPLSAPPHPPPQSSSFRRNFSSPLLVHEPPPACAMSKECPPTGECPLLPLIPLWRDGRPMHSSDEHLSHTGTARSWHYYHSLLFFLDFFFFLFVCFGFLPHFPSLNAAVLNVEFIHSFIHPSTNTLLNTY